MEEQQSDLNLAEEQNHALPKELAQEIEAWLQPNQLTETTEPFEFTYGRDDQELTILLERINDEDVRVTIPSSSENENMLRYAFGYSSEQVGERTDYVLGFLLLRDMHGKTVFKIRRTTLMNQLL